MLLGCSPSGFSPGPHTLLFTQFNIALGSCFVRVLGFNRTTIDCCQISGCCLRSAPRTPFCGIMANWVFIVVLIILPSYAIPLGLIAAPCYDAAPSFTVLQPTQQWIIDAHTGAVQLASNPSLCLTVTEPQGKAGSHVQASNCTVPLSNSQIWSNHSCGIAAAGRTGVLTTQNKLGTNAPIWLGSCSGTQMTYDSRSQLFRFSSRDGFNQISCKDCCLTWGTKARPCDYPSPAHSHPMCNTSLALAARVDDLITRIPQSDKANLLVNTAGPVDSLWIARQNWWPEALHGVQVSSAKGLDGTHSPVSFPSAISTAASFNKSLFSLVGAAKELKQEPSVM